MYLINGQINSLLIIKQKDYLAMNESVNLKTKIGLLGNTFIKLKQAPAKNPQNSVPHQASGNQAINAEEIKQSHKRIFFSQDNKAKADQQIAEQVDLKKQNYITSSKFIKNIDSYYPEQIQKEKYNSIYGLQTRQKNKISNQIAEYQAPLKQEIVQFGLKPLNRTDKSRNNKKMALMQQNPPVVKQLAKNTTQKIPKIQIEIKPLRSLIKLKSKATMPAMVTLKTSAAEKTSADIVCVIDNSGSMDGNKIWLVKKTIDYMVGVLGSNDRVSIVTFNDQAVKLTDLQFLTQANKEMIKQKLSSINAHSSTNITSGLDMALKIIRQRKFVNEATAIFLLSDGQNDNIYPSPKTVFEENLAKEQNKNTGAFTLYSFGYGDEHDQNLMAGLSQLTDGSFYYISKFEKVDEAFCNALGGVMSQIATDIVINLRHVGKNLIQPIQISKTFCKFQKISNKEYQIKLNSISSQLTKDFVFELDIPFINAEVADGQRNCQFLRASYKAIGLDKQIMMGESSLFVTLVNQHQKIPETVQNVDVIENYLRVRTAEQIEKISKKADEQKYQQAKKAIDNMIQYIKANKRASKQKKQQLINDLNNVKQKCTQLDWSSKGRKISANVAYSHKLQSSLMGYENSSQKMMLENLAVFKTKPLTIN